MWPLIEVAGSFVCCSSESNRFVSFDRLASTVWLRFPLPSRRCARATDAKTATCAFRPGLPQRGGRRLSDARPRLARPCARERSTGPSPAAGQSARRHRGSSAASVRTTRRRWPSSERAQDGVVLGKGTSTCACTGAKLAPGKEYLRLESKTLPRVGVPESPGPSTSPESRS